MTRCACGATTEGEPFANGWGCLAPGLLVDLGQRWVCPRCAGLLKRAWSFADAVDHEEQFE